MNHTKQEAAANYVFHSKHTGGQRVIEIETAAFIAGAEWAQLNWIPVTERLPRDNERYFCVTVDGNWIVGEYENDYIFRDASGYSWRCNFWCAIPDSLLNFKP